MKINHNKKEVVKNISDITGYPTNYSRRILENLLNSIKEIIVKEDLNLKNFGNFSLINKKQRIGRNPKTKKEYIIKAKKFLKFTPSKNFKNFVNN